MVAVTVPLANITIVKAGGGFGLALRQDGTVLSWGANTGGTLGNGNTNPSFLPAPVLGLESSSGVIALAPSTSFGLVLKADGSVFGWGANFLGQLGDGTFDNHLAPAMVSGFGSGSGVIAIAAGLSHSVALKSDGSVWTWGSNNNSNLGNPAIVGPRNIPVPVVGLGSDVTSITAGGNFSLALKADGTIWAWGNNNKGQLGIGSTINQPVPVEVKGPGAIGFLAGVVAVSAPPGSGGAFALALRNDGTVWAWGNNSNGQLGDGTTVNRTSPVQVKGIAGSGVLTDVSRIVAAGGLSNPHAIALRTDGSVVAWGSNANGQLGTGDKTSSTLPVSVTGLGSGSGITAVSGAAGLSFALKSDGAVLAWGDNSSGQLGDGSFFGRTTPSVIGGVGSVLAISAQIESNHSLAIRADKTIIGWGNNSSGQLGTGDRFDRVSPVVVPTLTDVNATAVGANHSLAMKADGSLWAWGDNSSGQLGNGTTSAQLTPTAVRNSVNSMLRGVTAVCTALDASYALTADGSVWAWGINTVGQLGINSQTNQSFATRVHGVNDIGFLGGVSAIATNGGSAYALATDGTVLAWGLNAGGRLGDGTTTERLTPARVSGLDPGSGVTAISAIAGGGAVLKIDGAMLAWGLNGGGQVGDGTTVVRTTPVPVAGVGPGSDVIGISAGGGAGAGGHTFALKRDGTLLSWGINGSGQLGDGTVSDHLTPRLVSGAKSALRIVAGGAQHSIAVDSAGNVWSWGANGSGQLGDGTTYTTNLRPSFVLFDDVTPPTSSSIVITPMIVGANGQITITKTLSDRDSGVASATESLQGPAPSFSPIATIALTRRSGTSFDGVWSGTLSIAPDTPDGTFRVTGSAVDGATNETTSSDGAIIVDRTPAVVSISVTRTTLSPPNRAFLPVTVSGVISDAVSGVAKATYTVSDEYGSVEATGTILLNSGGAYVVNLELAASPGEDDFDGRLYVIVVAAEDRAGNARSAGARVTVPHRVADRVHRPGSL